MITGYSWTPWSTTCVATALEWVTAATAAGTALKTCCFRLCRTDPWTSTTVASDATRPVVTSKTTRTPIRFRHFRVVCFRTISRNAGNYYTTGWFPNTNIMCGVIAELSMGPFCVTQSNPTHQLTDPTQPTTIGKIWTRPNPIQLTI